MMRIQFGKITNINAVQRNDVTTDDLYKAMEQRVKEVDARSKISLTVWVNGSMSTTLTGKEAQWALDDWGVKVNPKDNKETIDNAILARLKEMAAEVLPKQGKEVNDDNTWDLYRDLVNFARLYLTAKGAKVEEINVDGK